jgi:hypothetical protein
MAPTRTLATGAGTVLLAGLLLPAVPASAADSAGQQRHLEFTEVQTQHKETSASTAGPGIGDSFVFSADLTKHGKKVGTDSVQCTTTHVYGGATPNAIDIHCVAGFILKKGTLSAQGPVHVSFATQKPFKIAIVGGTGDFRYASGTLRVDPVTDTKSKLKLDFRTG